jgi:hypothetical protein
MSKVVYKVKYIGGSGIELPYPLTDGRSTIPGHKVIELENYVDFVRLTESPLFIEVNDEANKPVTEPVVEEVTPEVSKDTVVERTKTDGKVKEAATTTKAGD